MDEKEQKKVKKPLVAKKAFRIVRNDGVKLYDRSIKAGEDVSDVPEIYHANLKAEGVL